MRISRPRSSSLDPQSIRELATTRAEWFAEHILPYEPKVRAWLARAGWNADEIEDLIQESYARLAACAIETIHNPGPFFFQTARNTAGSIIRRRQVVSIRTVADVDRLGTVDPGLDPEEELSAHEELTRLKDAIEHLPPACRKAFVLRKIEGLSQKETADRLGVSQSAVEKHVARGIRLCAAVLTRPPRESGVPGVLTRAFWSRRTSHD